MIKLCDINDCTGCRTCYNICPKDAIIMKEDAEGFSQPEINQNKYIECKLCMNACPVLSPLDKYPKANPIAAISKDKNSLLKSSSGGIFTLIARQIINEGGVIFGAIMDNVFNVHHASATDEQGLAAMRGSKYVQSDTRHTFKDVKQSLSRGVPVLYTGTPCQIAGLRKYLGKSDISKLYAVDIVCHGVPSNNFLKTYISKLAQKQGLCQTEIRNFQFRDYNTWGNFNATYEIGRKKYVCHKADNIYMSLFFKSYNYRNCCYKCQYATPQRISDMTIADFWSIGELEPFPYDTEHGCSLILCNTPKGEKLFAKIVHDINYQKRSWKEAMLTNHQLRRPTKHPANKLRKKSQSLLDNESLDTAYKKLCNTPYKKLRRLCGKILRKVNLKR